MRLASDTPCGLTICFGQRFIIYCGQGVAQTQPRITYVQGCVLSDVTMGVRKRILADVVCHGCTKPIEGKSHRVDSAGVDARMHTNCADNYWHKMFASKGKALPIKDLKAHADIVADLIHTLQAYD